MAAGAFSTTGSSASASGGFAPSLVDSLFQRSLDDMIKALRSAPGGESSLIHRLLAEIRREIRSTDSDTKFLALQKLTYLSSLYFLDMSWAAFHALELLPSSVPAFKRSAYLCASLSFHHSSTELLPLATHQLRKDLQSPNPSVSSPALHLLALSCSPDLALHLSNDLLSLLSSPRAAVHVRCRAVSTSLPVLRLTPDFARTFLPKLVEALSPSSPLLSAAAGVFCELVSSGDPRPYLPLAPDFHRILLECRNNWVLIKIIKIFARLIVLEPRLTRKLVDPICELMRRSPAKSLVFECLRLVFSSFPDEETALRLAVEKVKEFVASDDDPNLRFLGLHGLAMLGPGQSWVVEESREAIVKSLADPDPNIRHEALQLIMSMVFENNVVEISSILINHALMSDPEFSNVILEAILVTCSRNFYELVMDFDWYVSLLAEMVKNPHFMEGEEVERQLIDIGLRVKEARSELVRVARVLLIDPALLGNQFLYRVLSAAAWILGEYIQFSRNPLEIVEGLLQPKTTLLPSLVRAVYIQAVFKIVTFCFSSFVNVGVVSDFKCNIDENTGAESEDSSDVASFKLESMEMKELLTSKSIINMLNLIVTAMLPLSECDEVEVQERACNVLGLIHILNGIEEWKADDGNWRKDGKIRDFVKFMNAAFSGELGPVSIHAHKRALVPEGLELRENLGDLDVILRDNGVHPSLSVSFSTRTHSHNEDKEDSELTTESISLLAEHRKRHGLYYLSTETDVHGSNEYPRANDYKDSVSPDDATNDLLKLTDQSSTSRLKKPAKPRPTVVRLDEDLDLPSSSRHVKEPGEDILSGAVRDVLSATSATVQKTLSENHTHSLVKESSTISNADLPLKENSVMREREMGSSSSRKGKHHGHGKEKNRNSKKNEAKEEKGHRSSARNSHRHGRHKLQQRVESGDASLDIAPQAQVVQDLLL
ncbi:AP-3 complex subunit delta [Phalaenopsis equestris]|uniref:AP-3 complex subunit delta n=1 Tax=Phalaenopsis equestris TaxID=78828 RepID=UPI0009E53829|nr:AP-3 complex subunit delta [Phalaenopsis equestris]